MPKKSDKPKTPRLTIEDGPLKIIIEGPSNVMFGHDLRMAAIKNLIEGADLGWVEKDDSLNGTTEANNFYVDVLKTLILKWKVEDLAEWEEGTTYQQILDLMVDISRREGDFDDIIPQPLYVDEDLEL